MSQATQPFRLDELVEWTSQAGGRTTTKRGRIVEVVPPKQVPKSGGQIKSPGNGRVHESYVVHVAGRGRYWPLVSRLRRVHETPVD